MTLPRRQCVPNGPTRTPSKGPPQDTTGLVVFAHGSESSRHSPRYNVVAETRRERGLGTLLFDRLTGDENRSRERFVSPRLSERLVGATDWLCDRSGTTSRATGTFGSSTGTAAALWARATARRRRRRVDLEVLRR